MFTDAIGDGCDEDDLVDYHRLQSHPSRQASLLKNDSIQTIVVSTQNVVKDQCGDYAMLKLSVLYSIPGGRPQGFHVDDPRTTMEINEQGEMISVVFALQNDTKIMYLGSN